MPTDAPDVLVYTGLDPRVTYNRGTRLNPTSIAWLNRLRTVLPLDIPIHVTSGDRLPDEQARAMFAKYQEADRQHALNPLRRDGAAELRAIYGRGLAAAGLTVDGLFFSVPQWEWVNVVEGLMGRGIFVSPHLRRDAVDLRTKDLPDSDLATLEAAVTATGAKPLREYAPPHLHVGGLAAAMARPAPAPIARVQGAGGGAGALVLPFALAFAAAALTSGGS